MDLAKFRPASTYPDLAMRSRRRPCVRLIRYKLNCSSELRSLSREDRTEDPSLPPTLPGRLARAPGLCIDCSGCDDGSQAID